jgi:hypothetical protein
MANYIVDKTAKLEESSTILEKTGDFIHYGLPDAVISAGNAFYDTGVALGNVFGGEGEFSDTEESIRDNLGDDYATYYAKHKTVVDTVGFVGGSFIPGTLAIKAGKALVAGTLATKTSSLATGVRNAMFSEQRLKYLETGIKNSNIAGIAKEHKLFLAKNNAIQNIAEAGLFEIGTLATMNQSPVINRDHLGYFEAIGENLHHAAFGVALGASIGGVIGYNLDKGKLLNLLRDSELAEGMKEARRIFNSGVNSIAGDEVLLRVQDYKSLRNDLDTINAMPAEEQAKNVKLRSQLTDTMEVARNDIIKHINDTMSPKGVPLGSHLWAALDRNGFDITAVEQVMSGAIKVNVLAPTVPKAGIRLLAAADDELPNAAGMFQKAYGDVTLDLTKGIARLQDDLVAGKLTTETMPLDYTPIIRRDPIGFGKDQLSSITANGKSVSPNFKGGEWHSTLNTEWDLKDLNKLLDGEMRDLGIELMPNKNIVPAEGFSIRLDGDLVSVRDIGEGVHLPHQNGIVQDSILEIRAGAKAPQALKDKIEKTGVFGKTTDDEGNTLYHRIDIKYPGQIDPKLDIRPDMSAVPTIDIFLQAAGHMHAQDIKSLFKMAKTRIKARGIDGKLIDIKGADAEIVTINRYKPIKGRKSRTTGQVVPPTKLSSLENIYDTLTDFQYEHNVVYRNLIDKANELDDLYKIRYNTVNVPTKLQMKLDKAILKSGKYTKDDFREIPAGVAEEYSKVIEQLVEFNDPAYLFSTAYRKFNNIDPMDKVFIESVTSLKGKYKPLYDWMSNNKALSKKFGTVDAHIDLTTGKLLNTTPAAAITDLGNIESINSQGITVGNKLYSVANAITPELTATEASARHLWMDSIKGAGQHLVDKNGVISKKFKDSLHTDDIALMKGVFNYYDFTRGALEFANRDGSKLSVKSKDELYQAIMESKKRKILEYADAGGELETVGTKQTAKGTKLIQKPKGKYLSEIKLHVDADENFITRILTGGEENIVNAEGKIVTVKESKFLTNDHVIGVVGDKEIYSPLAMQVKFDSGTFNNLGVREAGVTDASLRVQAIQEQFDIYSNMIFEDGASLLPSVRMQRSGAATIADDITRQDETTGLITNMSSGYLTGQSMIQAIGKAFRLMDHKNKGAIYKAMEDVGNAVNKSTAAVSELSILHQSILRSGKYGFFNIYNYVNPQAAELYGRVGVNVDGLINNMLKNIGMEKGNYIAEQEVRQYVKSKINEGFITDPKELETIVQEFGEETISVLTERLSQTLDEIGTKLNTVYRNSGQNKSGAAKTIHQIHNNEVFDFLRMHQEINNQYVVSKTNILKRAWGDNGAYDTEVLYPGRIDFRRFPHVAKVVLKKEAKDPWAMKGTGMLVAHSKAELERQIKHMESIYSPNDVEIVTLPTIKDRLKAAQAYDAELAFTDTVVDSSLQKEGLQSIMAPQLNPDVVKEMIEGIANQHTNVLRQGVKLKYNQEYATLEQFDKTVAKKTAIREDLDEPSAFRKNINQMLGLKDRDNHELWYTVQEKADLAIGKAYHTIRGAWHQSKTADDWQKFSALMDEYGMPKVYQEAQDWILGNAQAPRPVMQAAISQANGAFAFTMLRIDQAHALTTAISFPIMQIPQMQELRRAIGQLTPERAKTLDLATTVQFNSRGDRQPTNMKIVYQAIKNMWQKDQDYFDVYKAHGVGGNEVQQMRTSVDNVAYSPDPEWVTRVKEWSNVLAKPVDTVENSVKFIAADSARQVLDMMGLPQSHPLYWSTIRTFVDRVHGNYTAAQRPTLFQGWAGQAIGLFQTYQFNLMQQFFKNIEGGGSAAKYMVGLQAATFGVQSLPGFAILNQHIGEKTFGTKDFYSTTHDTFDNPVAEFMLYGGASSLTRPLLDGKGIDISGRGNLTPRTPIIIPTSFEEIPSVKFLSNIYTGLFDTYNQMSKGAPMGQAFLNGMAHNGISRPLQGAAQLLSGDNTSSQATLMFDYTDFNWANTVTKLMGSRTMDEAIAANAYYRSMGYRSYRMEQLNELGQVVRAKVQANQSVDPKEIVHIMDKYVQAGGKANTFNRWMKNNYMNATQSVVTEMRSGLESNEGVYMQSMLGNRLEEVDRNNMQLKGTIADQGLLRRIQAGVPVE